jgi:glycosyltransferase 2 family protein
MSAEHAEALRRRLLRPLLWSILAAVALYGGSVLVTDLQAVVDFLLSLGVVGWTIVLALSLVNYLLRFVRWEIYLRQMECSVPRMLSLAYYLAGFAFTTTPGKAGEAVRSLYLKRHDVSYVDSLAAFFSERLIDLVVMALLAAVGALAFPGYEWPVVATIVVVVVLLSLVHSHWVQNTLDRLSPLLPTSRLRLVAAHLTELLRSSSGLLKARPLHSGLLLGLLAWGAEGIAFWVILESLGIHFPVALAVGIYSLGVLAGALSFIPGGLGSTEASMVLMLTLMGADATSAVAATLICRLATLWFAVLIGGIMMIILESRTRPHP